MDPTIRDPQTTDILDARDLVYGQDVLVDFKYPDGDIDQVNAQVYRVTHRDYETEVLIMLTGRQAMVVGTYHYTEPYVFPAPPAPPVDEQSP